MTKITAILILLLLFAFPALSQDVTPDPGSDTGVTLPVATVEPAPAPDSTPAPADDNFTEIVLLISNVIAYGIILAQSVMQNGSVNRKTLDSFFAGLKGLGRFIPGDTDDKLFAGAESAVNTYLGERKPETPPAQPAG